MRPSACTWSVDRSRSPRRERPPKAPKHEHRPRDPRGQCGDPFDGFFLHRYSNPHSTSAISTRATVVECAGASCRYRMTVRVSHRAVTATRRRSCCVRAGWLFARRSDLSTIVQSTGPAGRAESENAVRSPEGARSLPAKSPHLCGNGVLHLAKRCARHRPARTLEMVKRARECPCGHPLAALVIARALARGRARLHRRRFAKATRVASSCNATSGVTTKRAKRTTKDDSSRGA